jgi:hypothetical protein
MERMKYRGDETIDKDFDPYGGKDGDIEAMVLDAMHQLRLNIDFVERLNGQAKFHVSQ